MTKDVGITRRDAELRKIIQSSTIGTDQFTNDYITRSGDFKREGTNYLSKTPRKCS